MRYRALSAPTATTPGGDYTFGQGQSNFLINSPAAVAQSVQTRLLLWQGEWFLDTTIGTPWLTQIIGKNTKSLYDTAIRTVVLQTVGVTGIVEYNSVLNGATRNLMVTMTINTQYGPTTVVVPLNARPPTKPLLPLLADTGVVITSDNGNAILVDI